VAPVRVAAFCIGGENAMRFLSDESVIGSNFTNADRTTNSQIIIISQPGHCSQQEHFGA
jgi:hypothetical protein